jgi:uncharacterized protein involved in exopolysaccharide biosynthesis
MAPDPASQQEIELLDYLRVIWRRRWMILFLSVVATGLTGAIIYVGPRYYRATVTIVPPLEILQKESGVGGLGAIGSSMLRGVMNTGSVAGMYVEILKSREVADSIINQFHLMEAYENVSNRSAARSRLKSSTGIETTEEGAVTISVTDRDPNRAATIANAYVEELDKQNKRLSAGNATGKRIFLENRLKEIEQKLSRIDTIPAHEAQVQEMLYELLTRECELTKIEEARNMPTIQVLDKAEAPEVAVSRGTIKKGMMAGIAAFMFGTFLALGLEYLQETKQAGLARQYERATRRRKAVGGGRAGLSGGNGQKKEEAAGAAIP